MACVPSPLAKQILAEANRIAPDRDHASDGICGDAAHQARKSYHNTGDAADTDHDPARGFDAHGWAEVVRLRCETGKEGRVAEIISNRRIATSRREFGLFGRRWQWRKYTGSNPHITHAHYSLNTRSSGAPFLVASKPKEWDELATKEEIKQAMREVLTEGAVKGTKSWAETNKNMASTVQEIVNDTRRIPERPASA